MRWTILTVDERDVEQYEHRILSFVNRLESFQITSFKRNENQSYIFIT